MIEEAQSGVSNSGVTPSALAACTILVVAVAILLCLIPYPSPDLFWQLRTGHDILQSGRVPQADTYSWVMHGTYWVVPEWLSFVAFWLAYHAAGLFGTWLLMVLTSVATALIVWFWLLKRVGPGYALVLTNLMLLALQTFYQERPYLFTYLMLAVSLIVVVRAREKDSPKLLWLVPISAVWTNLHQGVLVLVGLLLALAIGDLVTMTWPGRRADSSRGLLSRSIWTAAVAVACFLAGMISPYGWRVYWNVWVTIGDTAAMTNVREWKPIWNFPVSDIWGFYLLVAVVVFGYLLTRRPRQLGEIVALVLLLSESLLHMRNVPIFAIAAVLIAAPHIKSAGDEMLRRFRSRATVPKLPVNRKVLLVGIGLIYVLALVRLSVPRLTDQIGLKGYSPEGIGEAFMAVNWFPSKACDFMKQERFPSHLRVFNDYGIGGYLILALPNEPVFMDGRNDVYRGQPLKDYFALINAPDPDTQAKIVNRYDFDCIITMNGQLAQRFANTPGWQFVYGEPMPSVPKPRTFVFLRIRPEYRDLIARCMQDCEVFHEPN